jgi:hypothetical protein
MDLVRGIIFTQELSDFNPKLPTNDDLSAGKVFIEGSTISEWNFPP